MRWTEDRLRTKIPAKIREERRAEGLDPDVRPTHEWLRDNGYSGIGGFARRNDMSVTEVLEDICGFEPPPPKPLNINHAETRRLMEEWLEVEQNVFNQWGEQRISDARTHIRKLADVAYEDLGSTDLLRIVRADSADQSRLLIRLFTGLAQRVEKQGTESNYTRTLERWADYLALMEEIENHKVGDVRKMMGYTYERRSPEHVLDSQQVRACWRACDDELEFQALLVILAAAGNRRAEPTDIKVSQLRLDRDDPYIVFDEDRKTGAATVPIMAGVEVIKAWIEQLEAKEWWDGKWLFPSKKSKDGSRPPGWVNNVIETLVKRAGITFPDGEEPTPKHFRSFWYNHYISARQAWLAELDRLADEQGVESAEIIDMHYLTDQPERDHFRRFAEGYFAAVFGEELLHGFDAAMEARDEERDDLLQMAIDDYMDDVRKGFEDASNDDNDDDDSPTHESPAVADPISTTRARLRIEHAAAAASNTLEHYPPSPQRAVMISAGLVGWAALIGTIWGLKGVFYINPVAGTVTVTPGTIIGLGLGLALIISDLPDFEDTETWAGGD